VGKWRDNLDVSAGNVTSPSLPLTVTVVGKALIDGGRLVGKIKDFFNK